MAQVSFTHGKTAFAGEFTFPGKRRAPQTPAWLRSAAAMPLLFALVEPAVALPQIGPTSSASVGISLSVAAKYELRANEVGTLALEDGAASFCMRTNGQPTDLPVHLFRYIRDEPAAGQTIKEKPAQLHWCAAGRGAIVSTRRGDHGEEPALFIVRPE